MKSEVKVLSCCGEGDGVAHTNQQEAFSGAESRVGDGH